MSWENDFEGSSSSERQNYGEFNALAGAVVVETSVPAVNTIMDGLGNHASAHLGELGGLASRGIGFAASIVGAISILSLMFAGLRRITGWRGSEE
ncbi:MAG: hypothetical protein WCP97_02550 [bacterium]